MDHRQQQIIVVNQLEKQIQKNTGTFSIVSPVRDFATDERICLSSIHLPHEPLITKIQEEIISPLHKIAPDYYWYDNRLIHITIKNIRVVNSPPHFTHKDIAKAEQVFADVIPTKSQFTIYFYRLLLFANNLALIGTTDPQFDDLVFTLDKNLTAAGVPDDKTYVNDRYFFANATLARFATPPTKQFLNTLQAISNNIALQPYTVDSVSLITANAVLKNLRIIKTWSLH